MYEGAVANYQCLVLLCYLLLLEDPLEWRKYSLRNQLADYLVICYALLLERWVGKIAIFVDFSLPVFHNSVIKLKNDIEQLITTMIPLPEGLNPRVECF